MTLETPELIEAALNLRRSGRPAEALEALSKASVMSAELFTLRGDLQFELGLLVEAAGSYSMVLAFPGDNTNAQYRLALCLHSAEQWAAAGDAYRKLLEYDPQSDVARVGLGECLMHEGRLEEALASFDGCGSEAAQAQALFGKAVVLQLLGRSDEADSAYERLLSLEPDAEEALANWIALAVERADLVSVHRRSLRLLDLRPDSPVALQGLLLVALERRDYENAAAYADRLGLQLTDIETGSAGLRPVEYRPPAEAVEQMAHCRRIAAGE
jgi:tetratricopeptide (TPR) repeat protein